MASCFFIGHREVSPEIFPTLREAVEQHITKYNVTEFIVGNYGGFDHIAAKAVIATKERHPNITLSMLIPYHPADRPIEPPQGFDALQIESPLMRLHQGGIFSSLTIFVRVPQC